MAAKQVGSSRGFLRNLRRRHAAQGHIDAVADRRIAGWTVAQGKVEIEASIGKRVIARCTPGQMRPDVAAAFPEITHALNSGFTLDLPEDAIPLDEVVEVTITARPTSALQPAAVLGRLSIAGARVKQALAVIPESGIVGPFPRGVIDAVAARWPEVCIDLANAEGQRRFADRLRVLLGAPELRSVPVIADYARYLRSTWAHCSFVDRYFPVTNSRSRPDATDFHCKPNSVREIFPIVHQLFVLRSYGVCGAFAEFGCFKGFSSAMLSFACRELGVRMHIFDSFEGLPLAEGSGYSKGDYAGGLDEVKDHIARFGAIEMVEFHKGFFSDTFRTYRPPQLMCLWMDVDLESSARDLMVVADRLEPRASLFSHECTSEFFRNGEIVRVSGMDNPVPPMLDRFEELRRPLTGRFIAGNTGSFWPRAGGIPVMDATVLHDLVSSV
jgi:hypothetical protein